MDLFTIPCVHHDGCYRHGRATYNHGRLECDDMFHASMKKKCDAIDGSIPLGGRNPLVLSRQSCQLSMPSDATTRASLEADHLKRAALPATAHDCCPNEPALQRQPPPRP
jgi:hypothetical protein